MDEAFATLDFGTNAPVSICSVQFADGGVDPSCQPNQSASLVVDESNSVGWGQVYSVTASVQGLGEQGGTWSASVDPDIYIDPSFQYANDFALVVSPAIPQSTVPEPKSLWLMGAVLLTLALIGRRTRTSPQSLAPSP